MKRYLLSTMAALLASTSVLSIAQTAHAAPPAAAKQGETRVITDTINRKVTIQKDVSKIIAIPWPWSSFVFALDGKADRISTMSTTALVSYKNSMFQRLAPGLANSKTDYINDQNKDGGVFGTLNAEEIAKINPSMVLIYEREKNTLLPVLESVKIPTVVIQYGGIPEMQKGLLLLGDILGEHAKKNAAAIVKWHVDTEKLIKDRLKNVPESKKPKVLLFYNGKILRPAARLYDNKMIETAGGKNVAASKANLGGAEQVSFEQVLAWDPDIILVGNFADHKPDDIYSNKMASRNWQQLKAVKNKRVYKVPMGIYRWDAPNTETHLFQLWLAKMMHPELFADVSLEKHTRDFYKTLFNHHLSDAEMAMIYHDALNAKSVKIK